MVVATALMRLHERVSRPHVPADVRRCVLSCGEIWLLARCQLSDVAPDSVRGEIDRPPRGHRSSDVESSTGDVRGPERTRC